MSAQLSQLHTGALVACFMSVFLSSPLVLAQECEISLSEAQMDFGRVIPPGSNSRRNAGNAHELGNRLVSLIARCPKASKLMLRLQGETFGSQFRFAQQGQMSVTLSNALLDGRRVDLAQVKSVGAIASTYSSSIEAVPGELIIPISGGLQAQGEVLSLQVEIRPRVPVSELRTRDMKTLEANLSFQINSH